MSGTPNRRPHEDGGNGTGSTGGSVNHSHPSVLKYPHDDQGTYSGIGGKVVVSSRHDYHSPYDMGQEGRMPRNVPRSTESRDAERRSPLLPNMLFRVPTPNDSHSDHVGSESRIEFREAKDSIKENKVENRNMKSESRELLQTAKSDKYDGRGDDNKEPKHERDTYSEPKGYEKLDKDVYSASNSQLNWKDVKEQQRLKQYPDVPGGNAETWQTSRGSLHGPADAGKESLHVDDKDFAEAREAVGENKVDTKVDDKFKDKDRKRKEVKHWDLGERDKERIDRRNTLQHGNNSNENKDMGREERESERWGIEKKEPQKEKEKFNEKEKDNVKKELWNGSDKEAPHNEKELVEIPGKSSEQENSTLELKKKDHDNWKNVDREAREKKKERDVDVESERPDKRSKYHEKELEDSMHVDGGTEREREVFSCGVQQRKRMLRPRGSPQLGSRDSRFRSGANDNEGSQGKIGVSCVVYKIGECMQELIKLWKEYESLQADKACDGAQNGPTLEICIPAEHVTATNRQVRGGQLWGTDVYTVDSDLVAVLMHTGYCRPTASPPPSATQELRATIRVLPPQDCYISTLRNNVRSRAWGAAIGCSYRVERCCIVKKGGGIIDLEPCLTHSSTMEPTLAPVAVERTMTTRAAASNALRQQRFVREVTIQFNLCMEPWMKYSISAVADKGLKKSLFTSARLKKGEVLYVETHSRRYELCFNGEKVLKTATASHAHGSETGRPQTNNAHSINGERSAVDGESTVADIFRWSRCKRPLPQKSMQSIGIPLPLENVEVLEDNLEWDEISWSQTGAWIAGREYHIARAHFLSQS
ncbi:uncharacterized protein LOC131004636 [Salvia miltiorrhiza]|uniref:uncharacterized protein LOC131004636 n=1 Tax=Salvia miltiorrhiza TaxID=226208 RepID=UPI0025AC149E|nr:uncharacterized protein LOC131004636 [Salvia miltiorrhiza]